MPPKKPPHHPPPPHLKKPDEIHLGEKKKDLTHLIISVVVGTGFALVVGFILYVFNISMNVILPVLAPIWVGTITIALTLLKKQK